MQAHHVDECSENYCHAHSAFEDLSAGPLEAGESNPTHVRLKICERKKKKGKKGTKKPMHTPESMVVQ